jgi:FkbM family methyltransferase
MYQHELKRLHYARQISSRRFRSPEPEFSVLDRWLGEGDAAIDIGANVGHYTLRLAQIVGPGGRVLAFEPVQETFALLTANVFAALMPQVTLLNVAVSSRAYVGHMAIPQFGPGGRNYYQAHLTHGSSDLPVLCVTLDSLNIPVRVKLVKIDAEGHELEVLEGMHRLIARDGPVLIVERNSRDLSDCARRFGYRSLTFPESPNCVLLPADSCRCP